MLYFWSQLVCAFYFWSVKFLFVPMHMFEQVPVLLHLIGSILLVCMLSFHKKIWGFSKFCMFENTFFRISHYMKWRIESVVAFCNVVLFCLSHWLPWPNAVLAATEESDDGEWLKCVSWLLLQGYWMYYSFIQFTFFLL